MDGSNEIENKIIFVQIYFRNNIFSPIIIIIITMYYINNIYCTHWTIIIERLYGSVIILNFN